MWEGLATHKSVALAGVEGIDLALASVASSPFVKVAFKPFERQASTWMPVDEDMMKLQPSWV